MFAQFEIFGYRIGSYGLLAVIGCLVCAFILCSQLKKRGLMAEDGILFLVSLVLGGFIGGHLLFALTNIRLFPSLFEKVDFSTWIARFSEIFGGAVFYGGLFGGIAAGAITIKILRLDGCIYADIISPIIPLFHTFGRVGCFLAGCCYGIESNFGFYAESNPLIPAVEVRRFPVQLLEAILNLLLSLFLFLLLKKQNKESVLSGTLIYIYLISYGIIRFFDEFLRGDEIRGFIGVLSTSQWISIISVSIASLLLSKTIISKKRLYKQSL